MASDWGTFTTAYGTPLPKKLGVKPGQRIVVLDGPDGFAEHGLGPLPDGATLATVLDGPADLGIVFCLAAAELEAALPGLQEATAPDGAFWVAWPKRASKVPTDLTEDRVRELALPRGLVDTKVCAMNEVWSGLRLCLRRQLR